MITLKSSENPLQAIDSVTYRGQDPKRRRYHSGYEAYLNQIPVLNPEDEFLHEKIEMVKNVMQHLSHELTNYDWYLESMPKDFDRFILAIENPEMACMGEPDTRYVAKEGSEIVLARWGDGHSSPAHGHAVGYLHEQVIKGTVLVNLYRLVDGKLRPYRSDIYTDGQTIASVYTKPDNVNYRHAVPHSFKSIGESITLHFLPEHTRDSRDNTLQVEHFETFYDLKMDDMKRISSQDGFYLKKGDVCLVRSSNVPEYGDHFIVVTGHPILKPHGLRIQEITVESIAHGLLDQYDDYSGLVLLKLDNEAAQAFREFHDIEIINNEVIFPKQ
jgi:hypothetical protein